jgi:hypothetical protein
MGLNVKRQVLIKVIVTDPFKRQIESEKQQELREVDMEARQLEDAFGKYIERLSRQNPQAVAAERENFEAEKKKYSFARDRLIAEIKEIAGLEPGSEYVRGTIESQTTVEVGDMLFDKLGKTEIVIKDGRVEEIREK